MLIMENGADGEEQIRSMPSWPLAQWESEAWLADCNKDSGCQNSSTDSHLLPEVIVAYPSPPGPR